MVDNNKRELWARVNFPNDHVRAYEMTSKDGRRFDRMTVTIPDGVMIDGVDYGGWHFDAFMNSWSTKQKQQGKPVTASFRPGDSVELWRGRGQDRQAVTISDPWLLCRAVKARRVELESGQSTDSVKNTNTTTTMAAATAYADMTQYYGTASAAGSAVGGDVQNPDYDPWEDPIYLDPSRGEFIGDGVSRIPSGLPYSMAFHPDTDDEMFVVEAQLTLDCGMTITGFVTSTPIPDRFVDDHWHKYTVAHCADGDRWFGRISTDTSTYDVLHVLTATDLGPMLRSGMSIAVDGYQETGIYGDLVLNEDGTTGFTPESRTMQNPFDYFETTPFTAHNDTPGVTPVLASGSSTR